MTAPDDLDLANLPRFLTHLGDRDAGLATFVRRLLDAGWEVTDFRGPEQMDVWSLVLRSGRRSLRFGIERGFVDPVLLGSTDDRTTDFHPLSYAVLGWARSCGAVLPLDDPDDFRPDVGAHGPATLDWLDAGNDDTVDRIRSAWNAYRERRHGVDRGPGDKSSAEAKARGIRLIEQAAAGDRA